MPSLSGAARTRRLAKPTASVGGAIWGGGRAEGRISASKPTETAIRGIRLETAALRGRGQAGVSG